ncbi:Monoacylglycerol lipase ABHD12 [Armadillidium nasatum]|uniref:Monoacylglycerol lipase ABHD12 n=1 Tax=Armadillidium nasatum TaxID=96803 RepID=A0A5N5SM63_9CRUS|nr:Monoacylglycerol lipase ABHD12 [Armadillidium nasatum]
MSLKTVIISSLITLFVAYIICPLCFYLSPFIQRQLIFLNYVSPPRRVNFHNPDKEGLKGTRNFYLETEKGIKVGVWHILPTSLIDKCPPRESAKHVEWYEKSLSDHRPVFLYLHGNTSSRAIAHRVELYNLLRNQDWHVVAFDYRGYADSTKALMNETGVVHDAKVVYNYVRSHTGNSPLIVWGHSLGTGVSCHSVGSLCQEGKSPSALILESPFNNIRDEVKYHPLAAIFVKMPKFKELFLDPLKDTGIDFRSDEHITKINRPVLILHAKDDLVVPFKLGKRLYESAKKNRPRNFPPVKFVEFESGRSFGHKFICRAPELPQILRDFVVEVTKKR